MHGTEPILSIVMPAYKEKANLEVLVPQIEEAFKDIPHEIIVVDDGSKDGTRELLESLNATSGNIVLIERAGLMGIGSALRDGYMRARGELIVTTDADCSFSAADMRAIYEKAKTGYDLVLGVKVTDGAPHDKDTFQGWCENNISSPLSNFIIGFLSGMGLKNYNTNFRAIRTDLWRRLKTTEDRQFFHFEVILQAKRANARMAEIPVTFSPRKAGESKVSFFKQAPGYFWKLLRMTWLGKKAD